MTLRALRFFALFAEAKRYNFHGFPSVRAKSAKDRKVRKAANANPRIMIGGAYEPFSE